jgi:ComF family protein
VINTLGAYTKDFLHLIFPHYCEDCGNDVLEESQLLCLQCLAKLPETNFFTAQGNPIEKTFYGRLQVESAAAGYYFTKDSLIQHLMVELKYHNKREIGVYLGKKIGYMLGSSERFTSVDCIVPLPLNEKKLQKRGYNQAAVICEGIAEAWNKPVISNAVERKLFTETQTHKDRVSRWQTMQEVFALKNPEVLHDKHVLLVDDIVTTGATLEACGLLMLQIPGIKLSIATVAYTI